MSILHFRFGPQLRESRPAFEHEADSLYERDALGDLKHGLDLIFNLKSELDKLHPIAADTLIRLLGN